MSKYKFVKIDGKYIAEHRYVMEQNLGRKLNKEEIIHHKNGKKDDNTIENLMIVNKHNHLTIHSKIGYERTPERPLSEEMKKMFLTAKKVAEIFKTDIKTIRKWEKQGLPFGAASSRSKYYDFYEVRQWLKDQEEQA